MRHWTRIGLLAIVTGLVAGPVLAGGFGSGAPPSRIPIPAKVFHATVEDLSGTRVAVTEVTYNGEVFVYGNVGEGQATVPFENIATVRFEPTGDTERRIALVTLKDGSHVKLGVEADTLAYGRTTYGTYAIAVEKIYKIEFTGSVESAP